MESTKKPNQMLNYAESIITNVMKDAIKEYHTTHPSKFNNIPKDNKSNKIPGSNNKEYDIETIADEVVDDVINVSYTEFYSSHKPSNDNNEPKQKTKHPRHITSEFTQKLIDEVIESCIKQIHSQDKELTIEEYADSIVEETLNDSFKYFYKIHSLKEISEHLAEQLINETLKEYIEKHPK